jgi:RND family efflux transporter MFP subunit
MGMTEKGERNPDATTVQEPFLPQPRSTSFRVRPLTGVLFVALVAVVVAAGIIPRLRARTELQAETERMAVPTVEVVHPQREAAEQNIELPADIRAYEDAPIYARTSGYLKRWYVDIGAHVRAGQLLAEIDTPEIDQQLQQGRANLATTEADLRLAQVTAARYQDLLKTDSVSKQSVDNAIGNYQTKQAIVQAAKANLKRLQELQSFQRIEAPFDGVVTARNVDVGALIEAGTAGTGRELFHLVAIRKLRVYVKIPQPYSPEAIRGLKANLVLSQFPGKSFPATLVRTANAIDPLSRTLLVEFEVDNPRGEILPGAYAELKMKLPSRRPTYLLPVDALLFRSEGLHVVTVDEHDRAVLVPIQVGLDLGNTVEVVAGLKGDEQVIVNPPDSVVAGQPVRIVSSPPPGD